MREAVLNLNVANDTRLTFSTTKLRTPQVNCCKMVRFKISIRLVYARKSPHLILLTFRHFQKWRAPERLPCAAFAKFRIQEGFRARSWHRNQQNQQVKVVVVRQVQHSWGERGVRVRRSTPAQRSTEAAKGDLLGRALQKKQYSIVLRISGSLMQVWC